jgi:hypothetical protein
LNIECRITKKQGIRKSGNQEVDVRTSVNQKTDDRRRMTENSASLLYAVASRK